MKIAVLAPYLPFPPHAGGRIRMFELLRFLQQRHEVTLVTFVSRENELSLVEVVAQYCTRIIPVIRKRRAIEAHSPLPARVVEFSSWEMQSVLQRLNMADEIDIVDVEHIYMAQYASLINAPAILHEHNIESQVLRRYAELSEYYEHIHTLTQNHASAKHFRDAEQEWRKMAAYEEQEWAKFPVRITVSELDRLEMSKWCPSGKTIIIPNGVDTSALVPVISTGAPNALFIGAMDYQPNVDAAFELCDKIWPLVQQGEPEACLYIVGRKVPIELQAKHVPGQIEIISDAPDLHAYASQCCLSVVPLRVGGGTRIKILTAMALGLPVVSTTIGCEGLALEHDRDLLIADDPEHFAQQIVFLFQNSERRLSLARTGRIFVETHHDWQKIFPAIEQVFEELVYRADREL